MDKKIITIKVDSDEDEEKIMQHLKFWMTINFIKYKDSEISVTGKSQTIKYPSENE